MTLFFWAYDAINSSANSIQKKDQLELMKKHCVGDGKPDMVTFADQFAAGLNQFSGLYEDFEMQMINDPTSTQLAVIKKLKDCFFPRSGNVHEAHHNCWQGEWNHLIVVD